MVKVSSGGTGGTITGSLRRFVSCRCYIRYMGYVPLLNAVLTPQITSVMWSGLVGHHLRRVLSRYTRSHTVDTVSSAYSTCTLQFHPTKIYYLILSYPILCRSQYCRTYCTDRHNATVQYDTNRVPRVHLRHGLHLQVECLHSVAVMPMARDWHTLYCNAMVCYWAYLPPISITR